MISESLRRLNELTELLPEFPDSLPPPIPEEWLRAQKEQKPGQTADPVEGRVER